MSRGSAAGRCLKIAVMDYVSKGHSETVEPAVTEAAVKGFFASSVMEVMYYLRYSQTALLN